MNNEQVETRHERKIVCSSNTDFQKSLSLCHANHPVWIYEYTLIIKTWITTCSFPAAKKIDENYKTKMEMN